MIYFLTNFWTPYFYLSLIPVSSLWIIFHYLPLVKVFSISHVIIPPSYFPLSTSPFPFLSTWLFLNFLAWAVTSGNVIKLMIQHVSAEKSGNVKQVFLVWGALFSIFSRSLIFLKSSLFYVSLQLKSISSCISRHQWKNLSCFHFLAIVYRAAISKCVWACICGTVFNPLSVW